MITSRKATGKEALDNLKLCQPSRDNTRDLDFFDDGKSEWRFDYVDPAILVNVRFQNVMEISDAKGKSLSDLYKQAPDSVRTIIAEYKLQLEKLPPITIFIEGGQAGIYDGFKRACTFLNSERKVPAFIGKKI